MVAVIDKEKIKNLVRKICTEKRKISLLKDLKIWKRFEEKVIKLVDVGMPNIWGHFKDGIIKACNEVCGRKLRRCKVDTWWWQRRYMVVAKEIHGGYIERIMNEENDWDHIIEGDAVEGPVVSVSREEVPQALKEMKTGKGPKTFRYNTRVDCCYHGSRNSSDW